MKERIPSIVGKSTDIGSTCSHFHVLLTLFFLLCQLRPLFIFQHNVAVFPDILLTGHGLQYNASGIESRSTSMNGCRRAHGYRHTTTR